MKNRWMGGLCALAMMGTTSLAQGQVEDLAPGPGPLKVNLNEDGSAYARVIVWNQVWARAQQMNPGTEINGQEADSALNIGLRRTRFLVYGQLSERAQLLFHVGINNQTVNGGRKPQVFVHGAWGELDILPKTLSLGMGLHYWNGVSRLNNASTLNFLSLDMPIMNWPTIERSDQFARFMGIYAKGQVGSFSYRVAINEPFTPTVSPVEGGGVQYRADDNPWMSTGYLEWMFGDIESTALPYKVGTYLGKKSVLNLGAGWLYQPDAMGQIDEAGNEFFYDNLALGVDVFLDRPVGEGALTAYLGYSHLDFGPDFIRNVGIMNVGTGGTSYNGPGNAYPVIGSGEHLYGQAGYLLPTAPGGVGIQPYVTSQVSLMEALDSAMIAPELGVNWFVNGHNAKVTTQVRSRPIFDTVDGAVIETERAGEFMVQLHMMI